MRIVIAEDDTLLRQGLVLIVENEGIDVVAALDNGDELLAVLEDYRPDAAVLDVRMPPTHTDEGIRTAVAARRLIPDLPVLVLSAYVEQAFASDLLGVGARGIGYMLKERVGRVSEFVAALHRVVAGGISIDPEVVAQLFARRHGADKLQLLTPREGEVLAAMAEGLGNSAISACLYITSNAVHKHIRSIFSKLDLPPDDDSDRRVAAVLRYLEGTA